LPGWLAAWAAIVRSSVGEIIGVDIPSR